MVVFFLCLTPEGGLLMCCYNPARLPFIQNHLIKPDLKIINKQTKNYPPPQKKTSYFHFYSKEGGGGFSALCESVFILSFAFMKVIILVYMDVERYFKKMTILNQRTIKVSRDCDRISYFIIGANVTSSLIY